jgi:glycosyltransferase involved in cell wall biosynthesis
MKILFLIPYPQGKFASQRFRFEQYLDLLITAGIAYEIHPFYNSRYENVYLESGKRNLAITLLFTGILGRIKILFRVRNFDFVFIHREACPLGPPLIEFIIGRVFRKKIIYDFDDAIWSTDRLHEPWLFRFLKWRSKVTSICRWAYKISCSNDYLAAYAKQYNTNVSIIPSTIDTDGHHVRSASNQDTSRITVGWTGSHSTTKYLDLIAPVMQRLEAQIPSMRFIVISDRKPVVKLRSMEFVPWNQKTEIQDLQRIDIGIMPLPDDPWTRGKGGFKILQYLALEIPAVASNVGVNKELIQEGCTGFLCTSEDEWLSALKELIQNPKLREQFGKRGREFVEQNYSVASVKSKFLRLFA